MNYCCFSYFENRSFNCRLCFLGEKRPNILFCRSRNVEFRHYIFSWLNSLESILEARERINNCGQFTDVDKPFVFCFSITNHFIDFFSSLGIKLRDLCLILRCCFDLSENSLIGDFYAIAVLNDNFSFIIHPNTNLLWDLNRWFH